MVGVDLPTEFGACIWVFKSEIGSGRKGDLNSISEACHGGWTIRRGTNLRRNNSSRLRKSITMYS
jgi:hypothetical protein